MAGSSCSTAAAAQSAAARREARPGAAPADEAEEVRLSGNGEDDGNLGNRKDTMGIYIYNIDNIILYIYLGYIIYCIYVIYI